MSHLRDIACDLDIHPDYLAQCFEHYGVQLIEVGTVPPWMEQPLDYDRTSTLWWDSDAKAPSMIHHTDMPDVDYPADDRHPAYIIREETP